jgi:hypothetical protein
VSHEGPHPGNLSLLMVNLLGIIVLAEAFLFAFCAQVKVKGAFWWHHSVIGWTLGKLFRGIRFLFRAVGKVFGMMNIIWQWLLTAALMVLAAGISFLIAVISVNNGGDLQAIIGVLQFPVVALFCIGVVFYGGYAFHSRIYNRSYSTMLDDAIGYPASDGCLRMLDEDCRYIIDEMPYNTRVVVY